MPDRPAQPRSPPSTDVSALVARLAAAETALEKTLGSGADAVVDSRGHAHLLRQAQVALQQSENRFRTLIENSTDVIALLAADSTVLYDSPAITRVLGYAATELLGRRFLDFFHPEDQARARDVFADLCATPRKFVTVALRYAHKDGTYRWLEGTGTNLLDMPGVNAVVLNYRDVTERKDAEAALHLQSAGLTAAANGIVITDREGTVVWANPAFTTLTGYTLAEAAGKNPRDLVKSGQHERAFYQQMWETILAGHVWHGKLVNRRKDGSLYSEEQTITPVRDALGAIKHFIAIKQDLTARERAEAALQASESEFRSLAEAMPQIVWITRPDGWNVYFNQQWVDYTGLTLEESYGHGWNTPFHPDDRQRAWDAWQNATQNDAVYSVECRLRRADGIYHWWLIRGVPLRDASGKILKWFGTCTDIEDLKQAEIALTQRESEQRRLAESLELAQAVGNVGSWETDVAMRTVNWSPQTHRIFETTPDTFKPTHAGFLAFIHPDDRAAVDTAFLASLDSRAPGSIEHRIVMRDGRVKHVEQHWQSFADADDRPVRAVGTCRDITERKRAEEALRQQDADLRASNEKLRRFNDAVVGRELRMIELKQELNALCTKLGEPPRYAVAKDRAEPPAESAAQS